MTIVSEVNTALSAVLANTWAVELPTEPVYPAIAFDIDSISERNWVIGGGYYQHTITVMLFAKTRTELATYRPLIKAAIEGINSGAFRYLGEEDSGDAEFEELPGVYGYYQVFRVRERV